MMDKTTRELLAFCDAAMSGASRRYRISWKLPGNSNSVPGWVAACDEGQRKIARYLRTNTKRKSP